MQLLWSNLLFLLDLNEESEASIFFEFEKLYVETAKMSEIRIFYKYNNGIQK